MYASIRRYEKHYTKIVVLETVMDLQAYGVMMKAWIKGLWERGFVGAYEAAAGLA